jgi:hypothetical protein
MRTVLPLAAFAAVLAAPSGAQALELDYVGARAGTLGLGAEVGVTVLPGVNVRGIVNGFDYSFDEELDGIAYDGDLELGSFGLTLDVQPWPTAPVYASLGVFSNDNKISATGTPTGPTQIGNTTYTPAQIGTLRSDFTFEDTAPYAGLGLRFGFLKAEFNIEAGAYFQGSPQTTLTATGLLATDPTFQTDLAREQANVADDLENFEVYPVVNAGLRWKF